MYLIWTYCNQQCDQEHWIYTFQINDIYPWTNTPPTLHMYVPLHFYCSLHRPHLTAHIKNQYITFTILLQNIYPSNAINMLHAQITQCAFMEGGCYYICHIWSCYHQWCKCHDTHNATCFCCIFIAISWPQHPATHSAFLQQISLESKAVRLKHDIFLLWYFWSPLYSITSFYSQPWYYWCVK